MTALRICFVGDSITNGTLDPEYRGWPGRLCAAERERGHDLTCYNLGVRADTSRLIARRWRAECAARLPDVFPGALVFAFGVNDSAEMAGEGIRVPLAESLEIARAMIEEAKAWLPTLWIGPAPVDEARQPLAPGAGISYDFRNARVAAYSAAYAALAREIGVPYLDLYELLIDDPRWQAALADADGVHATGDGYAAMAEKIGAWNAWRRWLD